MDITKGLTFKSIHFDDKIIVREVDKPNNIVKVAIGKHPVLSGRLENWNLLHTYKGFRDGDYYLINPTPGR